MICCYLEEDQCIQKRTAHKLLIKIAQHICNIFLCQCNIDLIATLFRRNVQYILTHDIERQSLEACLNAGSCISLFICEQSSNIFFLFTVNSAKIHLQMVFFPFTILYATKSATFSYDCLFCLNTFLSISPEGAI